MTRLHSHGEKANQVRPSCNFTHLNSQNQLYKKKYIHTNTRIRSENMLQSGMGSRSRRHFQAVGVGVEGIFKKLESEWKTFSSSWSRSGRHIHAVRVGVEDILKQLESKLKTFSGRWSQSRRHFRAVGVRVEDNFKQLESELDFLISKSRNLSQNRRLRLPTSQTWLQLLEYLKFG